jgi:hypothetical protein
MDQGMPRRRSLGRSILLLLALMSINGCDWAAISTEPEHAKLTLSNQSLGEAPIQHQDLNFGQDEKQELVASQDGYFDEHKTLTSKLPEVQAHAVHLKLIRKEAEDATVVSDVAKSNTWVNMQVSSQFTPEQTWQKVVDAATNRYGAVQQMNETAGYLRSEWFSKTFPHPTHTNMTVRTQLVTNIVSRDPLVYEVMIRSELGYSDAPEKWEPYPRVYKEDEQLVKDLLNRLMPR